MLGHVAFEIGAFAVQRAKCRCLARKCVVLLRQADLIRSLFDDRQEFGANLLAAGAVQVLGGRILAAAQNGFGVGHAHLFHCIYQQRLRLRNGRFCRLVHAGFQLVDLSAHAQHFHLFRHLTKLPWQLDAHLVIFAETAGNAQLLDCNLRALGQGILEAAGSVRLRKVAQRQRENIGRQQKAGAQGCEGKRKTRHESVLVKVGINPDPSR